MKRLKYKLKNSSKAMRIFYIIFSLGYLISYIFFAKSIINLTGVETTIRYVVLGLFLLWFFFYTIFGLYFIITKKKKTFIFTSILTFLFIPVFGLSSYYIDKIYNKLENFTMKETSTYTSVLLAMKDTEITSDSKLGMISNEKDKEGYILAKELISKENLKNEVESYDDFLVMLNDLYNHKIDGIFVSGNYKILFGNEDNYKNIGEETKVVYSFSKEMKNDESTLTNTKKLTEPFTVLILGVDSESQGGLNPNAAFNGDTLMLISFNPNTLSATMFSIPRDMYVPIACNNNRYNKINSAAAYGTTCVINTVKQMTDINIDYFVKVNFKGVVDLVEAIGGIDVDVEEPDFDYDKAHAGLMCEQDSQRRFGENLVCITPGKNVHLNGEQALAYARCRHLYRMSDIARNQHHQAIIEALAKKMMRVSSFSDFEKIIDTISNNIATNMQTSQILSFYQTLKNMLMNALNGEDFISIQKTYLEYYGLPIYMPSMGMEISAIGYYPGSLKAISDAMKENLNIIKPETIKTFSYDYNKDYEYSADIVGKGIRTGETLKTMPNLIGNTVSYAENWAAQNGINLVKEFKESESNPGLIIDQSVHINTFLKNVSSVTIYISKTKITTPIKDPKDDEKDNTDEDEDKKEPVVPGAPTEDDTKIDTDSGTTSDNTTTTDPDNKTDTTEES